MVFMTRRCGLGGVEVEKGMKVEMSKAAKMTRDREVSTTATYALSMHYNPHCTTCTRVSSTLDGISYRALKFETKPTDHFTLSHIIKTPKQPLQDEMNFTL